MTLSSKLNRLAERVEAATCYDCPPIGYPTDKTRCSTCPRREAASKARAEQGRLKSAADLGLTNAQLREQCALAEDVLREIAEDEARADGGEAE